MLQLKVLILESGAVDGLAPSAVSFGEVSSLAHKVGDDTMESAALVAEPLLASAQSTEIFCRLLNHVIKEMQDDSTQGITINSYIEVNLGNAKHDLLTTLIITNYYKCWLEPMKPTGTAL